MDHDIVTFGPLFAEGRMRCWKRERRDEQASQDQVMLS